jgi:hypothetical protein
MRDSRRAAVALAILVATLIAMSGCAMRPDHTWVKTEEASADYRWVQVSRDTMYSICMQRPDTMANLGGCAFNDPGRTCLVYSSYSEAHARLVVSGDGESLFDHELRHCKGEAHYK